MPKFYPIRRGSVQPGHKIRASFSESPLGRLDEDKPLVALGRGNLAVSAAQQVLENMHPPEQLDGSYSSDSSDTR